MLWEGDVAAGDSGSPVRTGKHRPETGCHAPPLFTEAVRGLLSDSGVKPLHLPANSPNLNAYAERFVLSLRRECLDRTSARSMP